MKEQNFTKKRWQVLVATIPISICVGFIYAWSVFAVPLSEEFNVSITAITIAFTLSSGISALMNIIGGLAYDKLGPRFVLTVGGAFLSIGIFLTGYSNSLIELYIYYGIIHAIGLGSCYCTFLINTANAFPDKRGMATGIVIAGYGSGSFVFAPFGQYLIDNIGVLDAFKVIGCISFVTIMVLAQTIKKAPSGYKPEGWELSKKNKSIFQRKTDKDWKSMIKDPLYYVILGMVIISSTAGLMIMGHASAIIQTLSQSTAEKAAWVVGLMSISNAIGRFICPTVSDKIGRGRALAMVFLIHGIVIISLTSPWVEHFPFLVFIMLLVGFCYGGEMGVFPSLTTDSFGSKYSGVNFGLVLIGASVGSFVGPTLASVSSSSAGNYTVAFIIAGSLCTLGLILAMISFRLTGKSQPPEKSQP